MKYSQKDLNEFMFNPGRVCKCGARSVPHIGMAHPCPLTNSGAHLKELI